MSISYRILYLLYIVTLILFYSCGSDPKQSKIELSQSGVVNPELLSNLDNFLAQEPGLASISLAEIQNLAGKPQAYFAIDSNTTVVSRTAALKAQALINNIINQYDMKAAFDAILRVVSLLFNNKSFKPKDFNISLDGNSEIFDLMTCDEFIADPYLFLPQEDLENIFIESAQEIKKAILSCNKITSSDFSNCMNNINNYTRVINQDVNCSIKNKDQVSNLFRAKIKQSFDEVKNAVDACINEKFKDCGYDQNTDNLQNLIRPY